MLLTETGRFSSLSKSWAVGEQADSAGESRQDIPDAKVGHVSNSQQSPICTWSERTYSDARELEKYFMNGASIQS